MKKSSPQFKTNGRTILRMRNDDQKKQKKQDSRFKIQTVYFPKGGVWQHYNDESAGEDHA